MTPPPEATVEAVELLACPMCGDAGGIEDRRDTCCYASYARYQPPVYVPHCTECGLCLRGFDTETDAAAAWNTRITPTVSREGQKAAEFFPLHAVERKFTNSVGNAIEIYVATGIDENRLCRTSMYGPASGFDNYSTWDELVQMHSALSEVLGLPAPPQHGEEVA